MIDSREDSPKEIIARGLQQPAISLPTPLMAESRWPVLKGFLELTGGWAFILFLGAVWVVWALFSIQEEMVVKLRQQRAEVNLTELRLSLESFLAERGMVRLPDQGNREIQILLDQTLDRDRAVSAIDLISLNGVTLFSTDKGAVGETMSQQELLPLSELRDKQEKRAWHTVFAGEPLVGTVIAPGKVVGYLLERYNAEDFGAGHFLLLDFLFVFASIFLAWAVLFGLIRRASVDSERLKKLETETMLRRAAETWSRLDRFLAKIEESERKE